MGGSKVRYAVVGVLICATQSMLVDGRSYLATTALAQDVSQNGSVVVENPAAIDVIEPDSTVVSESPAGTARIDVSKYSLLSGREGGQLLFGGKSPGDTLEIRPVSGDSTGFSFENNGLGFPRLRIGGGPDASDGFVPGGLASLALSQDGGFPSLLAYQGALETGGAAAFIGVGARGGVATHAGVESGDPLLVLAGLGFDPSGSLLTTPAASMTFDVGDTPGPGNVPGRITFGVQLGTFAGAGPVFEPAMVIHSTGQVTVGGGSLPDRPDFAMQVGGGVRAETVSVSLGGEEHGLPVPVGGVVTLQDEGTGTVGEGEQVLLSANVLANQMPGQTPHLTLNHLRPQVLEFEARGTFAGTSHDKRLRAYFQSGTEPVLLYDTAARVFGASSWVVRGTAVLSSVEADPHLAKWGTTFISGSTVLSADASYVTTQLDPTMLVITVTGEGMDDDDVRGETLIVRWSPTPAASGGSSGLQ